MKKMFAVLTVLFLFILSCEPAKVNLIKNPSGIPLEAFQIEAKNAVVAAPNAQVSEAGITVLQAGGNAVDAAVAASFAMSVIRPQSTGIGGGGFMLIYLKDEGKVLALDFREKAPFASNPERYGGDTKISQDGALAVATPGLVAGLWHAYRNYGSGKVSWEEILKPAIRLAEEGFEVYPHLAKASEERRELLEHFPSSKETFLPQGEPLKIGQRLVQKDLARTLKTVAEEGVDGFYKGWVAKNILDTLAVYGGVMTSEDLLKYDAKIREPVAGSFLGYKIFSMPPPSSGGIHVVEILNMLENFPVSKKGFGDFRTVHWMIETMRRAYADRAEYLGDPDFVKVPQTILISKKYAKAIADKIDGKFATPSPAIKRPKELLGESGSTAHFSVVDQYGNVVASTQTINYYFGSGITVPGTGIVLNDEMDDFSLKAGVPNIFGLVGGAANAIQPGKRPLSSMSPTIVFDPEGKLFLVTGTPGGSKIITTVVQILVNSIAHKFSPMQSIAAPRIHHQWLPDKVFFEKGALSKRDGERLKKMGHNLVEEDVFVTDVQLIQRNGDGWAGVSDPRWYGKPAGF